MPQLIILHLESVMSSLLECFLCPERGPGVVPFVDEHLNRPDSSSFPFMYIKPNIVASVGSQCLSDCWKHLHLHLQIWMSRNILKQLDMSIRKHAHSNSYYSLVFCFWYKHCYNKKMSGIGKLTLFFNLSSFLMHCLM